MRETNKRKKEAHGLEREYFLLFLCYGQLQYNVWMYNGSDRKIWAVGFATVNEWFHKLTAFICSSIR